MDIIRHARINCVGKSQSCMLLGLVPTMDNLGHYGAKGVAAYPKFLLPERGVFVNPAPGGARPCLARPRQRPRRRTSGTRCSWRKASKRRSVSCKRSTTAGRYICFPINHARKGSRQIAGQSQSCMVVAAAAAAVVVVVGRRGAIKTSARRRRLRRCSAAAQTLTPLAAFTLARTMVRDTRK